MERVAYHGRTEMLNEERKYLCVRLGRTIRHVTVEVISTILISIFDHFVDGRKARERSMGGRHRGRMQRRGIEEAPGGN